MAPKDPAWAKIGGRKDIGGPVAGRQCDKSRGWHGIKGHCTRLKGRTVKESRSASLTEAKAKLGLSGDEGRGMAIATKGPFRDYKKVAIEDAPIESVGPSGKIVKTKNQEPRASRKPIEAKSQKTAKKSPPPPAKASEPTRKKVHAADLIISDSLRQAARLQLDKITIKTKEEWKAKGGLGYTDTHNLVPEARREFAIARGGKAAGLEQIGSVESFAGHVTSRHASFMRKHAVAITKRNNSDEFLAESDQKQYFIKDYQKLSLSKESVAAFAADVALNQEYVRSKYGENLTLHRGLSGDYVRELMRANPNLKPGDEIEVPVNAVSSWTVNRNLAKEFAKNKYGLAGPDASSGMVVESDFSYKDVAFSSDLTGSFHNTQTYKGKAGQEMGVLSSEKTVKVRISEQF